MNSRASMTVVDVPRFGGPECLTLGRRPVPLIGKGEVLIRVTAAGVNRADTLQRMGRYPPPPGASDILGLEVAGEIVQVGSDVSGLALGQRVCALLTGGGYADYAAAPAPQCLPIPTGLTDVQAASLPEAAFTVWYNIVDQGGLEPGHSVLIHGGTSGIGTMAIQMVTALGGRAIATAGSERKLKVCRQLGAIAAINYESEDFVDATMAATGGRGADIILDMVGGDYLPRNMAAAAPCGRLLHIAFLRGACAQLDISKLMHKRLIITGSTLRPRSVAEKGKIAASLAQKIWPAIENGTIAATVDSVYSFGHASDAHRQMESSQHIGKIVLIPQA